MSVTRKLKNKIRRSGETDMISDFQISENMDVTIGSSQYEREGKVVKLATQLQGLKVLAMTLWQITTLTRTLIREKMRLGDLPETAKAQVRLILIAN